MSVLERDEMPLVRDANHQSDSGMSIGEASERTATSERALRYYEALGLLKPSAHTRGGMRRYSAGDLDRILRIRELKDLLSLDLGAVRIILDNEDRLVELAQGLRSNGETDGPAADAERRELLQEAVAVRRRLIEQVQHRQERLASFRAELEHGLERSLAALEVAAAAAG